MGFWILIVAVFFVAPLVLASIHLRLRRWSEAGLLTLPIFLLILLYDADHKLALATAWPAMLAGAASTFRRRYKQASLSEMILTGTLAVSSALASGVINAEIWEIEVFGFESNATGWFIGGTAAVLMTVLLLKLWAQRPRGTLTASA